MVYTSYVILAMSPHFLLWLINFRMMCVCAHVGMCVSCTLLSVLMHGNSLAYYMLVIPHPVQFHTWQVSRNGGIPEPQTPVYTYTHRLQMPLYAMRSSPIAAPYTKYHSLHAESVMIWSLNRDILTLCPPHLRLLGGCWKHLPLN